MTVSITMTPLYPDLTGVLLCAAITAWCRYVHLWVTCAFRGAEVLGKMRPWMTAGCVLMSATLLSGGNWVFGIPFDAIAALCAGLWLSDLHHGEEGR